jgi:DNA repair exonuclease SbcCD ATPase subunit
LPPPAKAALACLLAETSDGFQTRLWDNVALGPLPSQPPSANAGLNAPKADLTSGFTEAPPVIDLPLRRHESQLKASATPTIQSELLRDRERGKRVDQEASDDLSLVTGLHAQLGRLLEGLNRASHTERQLHEANEQLTSSRAAADEARRLTELEVAKSVELKASLERANTREEQNLSDLAELRGSVASLQKRVDSSEAVIKDLRANIAQLQGDLEEAARARILFGEQRASEVRNGLREKITHEVSGLPSLGPDLGEEHFAMVRVRFKNLLKLLAENDICAPLPGVVAR